MFARQPAFKRTFTATAATALLSALTAMPASAASCTWNTTAGNWNALANWLSCATGNGNPAQTPGSNDTATIGSTGVVTVNTAQLINTLNNAGLIDITANGLRLGVGGGGTTNTGTIQVGNAGVLSFDSRAGATSLSGNGQIVLQGAGSRLFMEGTGNTTSSSKIRGQGQIGQAVIEAGNASTEFINNGTVSADAAGATLELRTVANVGSYRNNGLFEARNGGTLQLSSNVLQGASGVIKAETGSVVLLNGSRISGGLLDSAGTGSLRASSSSINVLAGTRLNGVFDLQTLANSRLTVGDGLDLNGSINVGNGGELSFSSRAGFASNQTLSGSGAVTLNGASLRVEGTGQTTLGSNIEVRGSGNFGQPVVESGSHTLINNGLISADVNGQTLQIQRIANGSIAVQNNGVLEAINGGTLLLSTDIAGGTGSLLRAQTGSTIRQNGVTLTGTVTTSGSGVFTASASSANILSGVTFSGSLNLGATAGGQATVANGMVLNGTVDTGNGSQLSFSSRAAQGFAADQTVAGTGVIRLDNSNLRVEGVGSTTLANGIEVRGFGNFGQAVVEGGNHTLINNGLISADVIGQTLQMQPVANGSIAVQNNGTLQAANGGTLLMSTGVVGGTASSYAVNSGSTILMNGVTLSGLVNQTGTGALTATNSSANLLSGVDFTGRIDLATAVSQLRVAGGLALNGRIEVGAGSRLFFDNRVASSQTISGNGSVVLSSGIIHFEAAGTTTWDSGVTVRGQGTIGQAILAGGAHALQNNGTLLADGGLLTVVPIANGGGVTGTGTLQVAGGTLNLATNQATAQGRLLIGNSGSFGTGNQNLTLSGDYVNDQAGSGNSFNRRAGITGTGQVLAAPNAAQLISGTNVTGGNTTNATLTIGNVRVGATNFTYGIGNSGSTGPTLRGAVQTNVNGANLTDVRLSGSGVTANNYNAGAPAGAGESRTLTFTTASAGPLAAMTGQVLNLRSNFENIADQKLNIVLGAGAAAYNPAVGNTTPAPAVVGNQRVGGSGTAALTVSNTAPAGSFSEDLRASFGANSGDASNNGGLIGNLLAGSSNSSAMRVGVNTASAGAKTGTVTLNYETTGTVNGLGNGLGMTSANAPQQLTVNGNVFLPAAGSLQTGALNFGTLQVGQSVNQNLVVRNAANGPAGFVEDLNVAFGAAGNGQITGAGSFSGIAAGANSSGANGSMTVTVLGTTAGPLNSSIAVNYASAGAVAGVSNGLGTLAVGSENFAVNGTIATTANVINQASPLINTPRVNLGAVRVGAPAPTGNVSVSNLATAAPQAALNAGIAPVSGPITASGSFNLLAPGATNSSSLVVGLNTGTAGNFTGANAGQATVSLVSDANNVGNCTPNCQLNLASQVVTVEGKVYSPALGSSPTTALNFGIVRVGDTVSARNIVVNNTAAASGLNDSLRANLGGSLGPFGGSGTVGGVAAGGSGNIGVTLDTAANGVYSHTGTLSFLSQNADLADISAGPNHDVLLQAQVNAAAFARINLRGGQGSLSRLGDTYTLDFGTVAVGTALSSMLDIDNAVAGPADELNGSFNLGNAGGLVLSNWNAFMGLIAGADTDDMVIDYTASGVGLFERQIGFSGTSTNASDPSGLALMRTLVVRANVTDGTATVPEPGSVALLLTAAAAALLARRRSTVALSDHGQGRAQ